MVCRLVDDKGIDLAIEAFASAHRGRPERKVRLVIVGEGPEKPSLQRLAQQLKIDHLINFPGFAADPSKSYCGFDAFLMPSRVEPLGISLLEAMACGLPVIASRVGGMREILANSDLGFVVPPEDSDSIATAMTLLLKRNRSALQLLGARNRQHVVERYSSDYLYDQIIALAGVPQPGN